MAPQKSYQTTAQIHFCKGKNVRYLLILTIVFSLTQVASAERWRGLIASVIALEAAKKIDLKPIDLKPIDLKPIDLKPIDIKPIDLKPITLRPIVPIPDLEPQPVEQEVCINCFIKNQTKPTQTKPRRLRLLRRKR